MRTQGKAHGVDGGWAAEQGGERRWTISEPWAISEPWTISEYSAISEPWAIGEPQTISEPWTISERHRGHQAAAGEGDP